ncbi:LysM peptidoglycan-binding domain-containing protein [Acidovorax sp. RAC01]|uniref:LysM peptidoglycan-binding domain-containing protein n=1 Tax=Acidovorax sp. RAC01 TaxID=1842533 RepID=UPI000858735D|nr:LysM domain-containing protein [Acidovorax sp. RAC01]AOG21505.1 lysM domain protein [Acidovorax sp. RAC01]
MTAFTSMRRNALGAFTILAGATLCTLSAHAQNPPVSGTQRATAQQVSERGIPLSELAPNAPDTYTVKRGDTLWGISGMYLKRPWRWPELWGMNLQAIPNPHLIFPGQTLYLDRSGGYARLSTTPPGSSEPETVRVSPRTRSESLGDTALPTLKPHLIEPFLVEPLVVDAQVLQQAPRIIATTEERVLMATGDRAYVRSHQASPLQADAGDPRQFRVFRDAVALKDPATGEILGYEAQYLGRAELIRGESFEDVPNGRGGYTTEYVPATIDLKATKEEIRAGDRLLPMPGRAFVTYTPRAPQMDVEARVVSIYGSSAVAFAAQNQVVAISVGSQDGVEPGHVLTLLSRDSRVKDVSDGKNASIKLPNEDNGTVMVFRTFERVSYALLLEIRNGVRVGDRLVNPK